MTSGRSDSSQARRPRHRQAGGRRHSRGFTLLEVIIVMMLITVFLSVAAMNFASLDSEEVARKPANELIRLAKQAVRASAVEGRPFIIQFDKTGFGVLGKEGAEGGHVPLPEDTQIEILRWGEKAWLPAEGQGWMFGANGLCEAIKVRFLSPAGIMEMGFNPLTGSPVDEKYLNP